jgi:hypothetical protein
MGSVSNGSGLQLQVQVQIGTEPLPIHCLGHQCTRTVNSGKVRWSAPNLSELGELLVGCPAGLSVNLYNALVFAIG